MGILMEKNKITRVNPNLTGKRRTSRGGRRGAEEEGRGEEGWLTSYFPSIFSFVFLCVLRASARGISYKALN